MEAKKIKTLSLDKLSEKNIYRLLFETAAEGLVVVDKSGLIKVVNPRVSEMFGYSMEEMEGQTIEILIPESIRKQHVKHRQNYNTSPHPRSMGQGMNLLGRRKDGTEFPAEISLNHIGIGDDMLVMGLITDITARKKAEAKLLTVEGDLQALKKEKELSELKSRFVSMASHEFRTPLSTILSSVSLAEKYKNLNQEEKRDKHYKRIKSAVYNLTGILNDFLSIDKLEQGKIEANPVVFDVPEYIQDVVEEMQTMAKTGQEIKFIFTGERKKICLDKHILKNILINLISNAIKYSPEGKVIEVNVHLNAQLKIEVKDHGIGIPKEEQKHLFERFFRAKNSFNIQGTGLGLNIVKKYTELMGGELSFESEEEIGTTFTVELPQILEHD